MPRVRNHKVIRTLSVNLLKSNKKQNRVIILAVLLTCILFTSLFSIGASIMKSMQQSTMRQVGGTAMAGVKWILPEDLNRLAKDNSVKDPSYRIIIASAENQELVKLNTEINYAQDRNAEGMFSYPSTGTMPRERLELATSTLVLDALGLPYRLGETVTLEFTVNGEKYIQDFTLSGYWEGDPVAQAQQCYVSRNYCDEVAPTPTVSFNNSELTNYSGYWMMDFNFSNSWNIEGKTIKLLMRHGYDPNQQGYGINWAYTSSFIDMQTMVLILIMLAVILTSGYLIINNVFYINVTADISKYGLLKTIGTTGKQLKRLVRQQAIILSFLGITLGLILGTGLSRLLLPAIMKNFSIGSTEFSISPVIYVLATLFTYLTVRLSLARPCALAAKVSPLEAIRYTEKYVPKKKRKHSSRVSVLSMAKGNIGRSRKKAVIVVLSLSLSMILVNSIYSIVHSLDMDKYIADTIIGDFVVTDASVNNFSITNRDLAGVSEKVSLELSKLDGVEQISNIYCYDRAELVMDDQCYNKIKEFAVKHAELFPEKYEKQVLDYYLESRFLQTTIYGMDEWAFGKLIVYYGELDQDKFASGDYVVIFTNAVQLEEKEIADAFFYEVGDKIPLKLPDGTVKEYEVMAIADVPYAMSTKSFHAIGANAVLPTEEYLKHSPDSGALYSIINVVDNKVEEVEEFLQNYTTMEQTSLDYLSRQTYLNEFKGFVHMFWIVGSALSVILAFIGILNFLNTILTSMIARRQEFAMLEAVGMTGKQLKAMVMYEGIIYAFFTVIFSVTFGSLIGYGLINAIAGQIWFFSYHFTMLPIALCSPLLAIISCLIPHAAYRGMCKRSIVERLKVME